MTCSPVVRAAARGRWRRACQVARSAMGRCASDAQSVRARKSGGFERCARSVCFGIIRLLRGASHDENSIPCREPLWSLKTGRAGGSFPGDLDATLDWTPETELAVAAVDDQVSAPRLATVTGGLVHVLPAGEPWPVQKCKIDPQGGLREAPPSRTSPLHAVPRAA
jgi:hypothetical protein